MDGIDYDLAELIHHWGEAYLISRLADGRWLAQRRDNRETVTAEDANELHEAIKADYARMPVPR
jgi:hypothetical protein